MNKSGLNDFLLEIIHSEKVESVLAVTTRDLSSFANLCEDSLKSVSIINLTHLDSNNAESCDLCIIFDDMPISKTQVGIVKNILAQKILIFNFLDRNNTIKNPKKNIKKTFKIFKKSSSK